jgi:hypothetical protein
MTTSVYMATPLVSVPRVGPDLMLASVPVGVVGHWIIAHV